MGLLLVAAPAVLIVGLQRTIGNIDSLAPLIMIGESIVERPPGWLPHSEAKAQFRAQWCVRENIPDCNKLTGSPDQINVLYEPDISGSINDGGALRMVDLRSAIIDDLTDWRNTFFDGSVKLPEVRRNQIGQPCLWDWIAANPEPLQDAEFFGRWRGWLATLDDWDIDDWKLAESVPEKWRDVTPIAPPPGCAFKMDDTL